MYINPIILGVAATIGGECVLAVLALVISALRYSRRNGLTVGSVLRAAQSFATVWSEAEAPAPKQATKAK